MIKKFKSFVKNIDGFGYNIPINFNEKGSTHNTIAGGLLSLIYNLLLVVFTIFCIVKTIYHL